MVEISTDKVVHAVDVTGKPARAVAKVAMGMRLNLNVARFRVRDTGAP